MKPLSTTEVLARLEAGFTAKQVAKEFGVSIGRIEKIQAQVAAGAWIATPELAAETTDLPNEPDPTDDAPDCWEVTLQVDMDKLDYLIGQFSLDDAIAAILQLPGVDKANIYAFVIQRRLNLLIDPPTGYLESLADSIARFNPIPPVTRGDFVTSELIHNATSNLNPEENHAQA